MKKKPPLKQKQKELMRINRFLGNKYFVAVTVIILDIFFFLLINFIVNIFSNFSGITAGSYDAGIWNNIKFPLEIIKSSLLAKVVYILFAAYLIFFTVRYCYLLRSSFSSESFNVGQKGDERWTTLQEIKEQFLEIDDKNTPWEGEGAIIVARYGNKLYIDTRIANTCIWGISRAGKGEMDVLPTIEVNSRASLQPDQIIVDTKIELYKSSSLELRKRGYEVHLLNLADALKSMGYNPIQLITELFKNKKYEDAELLSRTLGYSYFNPDEAQGDMKFFALTAADCFTAMVIAGITDALKEDEKINEKRYKIWCGKQQKFMELDDNKKEEAKNKYEQVKASSDDEDFWMNVAAVRTIPEDEKFIYSKKMEKTCNLYSIINTFTELESIKVKGSTNMSAFDLYFSNRPPLDRAKLKYSSVKVAGDRTKGSIFAEMLSKLTVFTFDSISRMTAETSIDLNKIGFDDHPYAIYIGVPDYDKSMYFLVTAFVRQLYYVLSKNCGDGGKCKRRVIFHWDECGNSPAMENMDGAITVGNGRNICFNLYFQDVSQVERAYPQSHKTIRANCAYQKYIMVNDIDSAKAFSELLGEESIVDLQRSGKRLEMNKHFTENIISKPLLNANQLMDLLPGENVIKRVLKRTDLKGNFVVPHPIFNSVENGQVFKFRYEYMEDVFPSPNTISLDKINDESRDHIDMSDRVWDYNKSFSMLNNQEGEKRKEVSVKRLKDIPPKTKESLLKMFRDYLGSDYEKNYGITKDSSISEIAAIIGESTIYDNDKKLILNALGGV